MGESDCSAGTSEEGPIERALLSEKRPKILKHSSPTAANFKISLGEFSTVF